MALRWASVILNPEAKDVSVAAETSPHFHHRRPVPTVTISTGSGSMEIVRRINHCGDGQPWDGDAHRTLYPSKDGGPDGTADGAAVIAYIHPGGFTLPPDATAVIVRFFKQFPKLAAHPAQ